MDEIGKLVSLKVNLPPEQSLLLSYPGSQKQDPSGTQTRKTYNTFNDKLTLGQYKSLSSKHLKE